MPRSQAFVGQFGDRNFAKYFKNGSPSQPCFNEFILIWFGVKWPKYHVIYQFKLENKSK